MIRHEPENTQCACGCQLQRIGEDVSEKLDYTPGVFTVEHHVRGKWACRQCETLIQAPVPAQVIDKGVPTAGLLAHVMVAKFADHLPLYRQEKNLWPRRAGDCSLDLGPVGRTNRCATPATGRCTT
ncbi:IS66 family transposase zinc-finger binding domain-containing protein [Pseudomonas putida]|uniref:IS66 family transposase zinc-finger binding domain-containing protein n=1 Tax=Pseudomonas putida TaxID=303 RepID=UPI0035A5FB28